MVAAIAAFTSYPHSGFSHDHGNNVLIKLLDRDNLTPLTWDPAEWIDRTAISNLPPGATLWQSTRNPKAFSGDQGKTYWLTNHGRDLIYYPTISPWTPPFRMPDGPFPPAIAEDGAGHTPPDSTEETS